MHPFGFGRNKSILQCRHDVRNLRKHMANVFGDLPSRKHSFWAKNIPYLEGEG